MCGGQNSLRIFEIEPGLSRNVSLVPLSPGWVPFKLQMCLTSGLLVALMRIEDSSEDQSYQLQVLHPDTGKPGCVHPL